MTITSKGYDGTVSETDFARMARNLGAAYAVEGAGDWRVTAVAGQDRTVAIAAGAGYGHGVRNVSDTVQTLQLAVAAAGSRWDLVAARRDWQPPGGATTFVKIEGTGARLLPTGRNVGPGVLDDQPLALVQITAGQSLPTAIVDLRTWPSKVTRAADQLALVDARLGDEVVIGGKRWRVELDSTNSPALVPDVGTGAILGVYQGAFNPNLPPGPAPYQNNKVWSGSPLDIAWCDIPDPGRPYRVQLNCAAEMGSVSAGTRWDFAALVSIATPFGTLVSSDQVAHWQQLISPPSHVVSGAQRVILRAGRVYGPDNGMLTPFNQSFTATVIAA